MESQTKLSRREKTGMIVRYLRGCWGFFAGAVVLAWMNTACNALVPQIISFTVDSVLGGEPPDLPGFLRPLIPVDQLRAEPLSFLWLAAGAVVLAAAVRGQETALAVMEERIDTISAIADRNLQNAEETEQASGSLAREAEALQSRVRQFTLKETHGQ